MSADCINYIFDRFRINFVVFVRCFERVCVCVYFFGVNWSWHKAKADSIFIFACELL